MLSSVVLKKTSYRFETKKRKYIYCGLDHNQGTLDCLVKFISIPTSKGNPPVHTFYSPRKKKRKKKQKKNKFKTKKNKYAGWPTIKGQMDCLVKAVSIPHFKRDPVRPYKNYSGKKATE